jgi:hypothetical protein
MLRGRKESENEWIINEGEQDIASWLHVNLTNVVRKSNTLDLDRIKLAILP